MDFGCGRAARQGRDDIAVLVHGSAGGMLADRAEIVRCDSMTGRGRGRI
jgi:hypothetical protein